MKQLTTKLVKLDLDYIMANYKKEEFWEKEWLIFSHNDINLFARLDFINVKRRLLSLVIYQKGSCVHDKKSKKTAYLFYNFEENITIPISHSDYTKEKFESDILISSLKLIEKIERKLIEEYSEYEQAQELEEKYKDSIRELAEETLDNEGISNYAIRDAYIDSCIDNAVVPDYTYEVIRNFQYTIIPNTYLLLISYFNDEKKYEKYSQLTKKTRKSTKIKIWLEGRKLDTDEWREEMRDSFDSIS